MYQPKCRPGLSQGCLYQPKCRPGLPQPCLPGWPQPGPCFASAEDNPPARAIMPMIISLRKDTPPGPDCAICNDLTAKLPNGSGCGANTDDGFKFPHPNCESSGAFPRALLTSRTAAHIALVQPPEGSRRVQYAYASASLKIGKEGEPTHHASGLPSEERSEREVMAKMGDRGEQNVE